MKNVVVASLPGNSSDFDNQEKNQEDKMQGKRNHRSGLEQHKKENDRQRKRTAHTQKMKMKRHTERQKRADQDGKMKSSMSKGQNMREETRLFSNLNKKPERGVIWVPKGAQHSTKKNA